MQKNVILVKTAYAFVVGNHDKPQTNNIFIEIFFPQK